VPTMAGWIIWLIVACAFGLGEMLTNGFFLAPFAVGGVLAAVAELTGSEAAAWITFVVATILTLAVVRPLVMRHMHQGPALRTGAAALIGRHAIVLERISNGEGGGRVKIGGEVWTARSLDDDRVIEVGTQVEVVDIHGATALVME
jgi:membrane protein implicated in regulation of membrane protease activity